MGDSLKAARHVKYESASNGHVFKVYEIIMARSYTSTPPRNPNFLKVRLGIVHKDVAFRWGCMACDSRAEMNRKRYAK